MDGKRLGMARGVVGVAGIGLIVSVFLPWAEEGATSSTAWELEAGIGVLCLLAGVAAITAAATDGTIGIFRPDLSAGAAADILSLATALVVGTVVLFDIPSGAAQGFGVYLALAAAIVVACGCGDWRVLRGAPLFPR